MRNVANCRIRTAWNQPATRLVEPCVKVRFGPTAPLRMALHCAPVSSLLAATLVGVIAWSPGVAAGTPRISVQEGAEFHVHAVGEPLEVVLRVRDLRHPLDAEWQDYRGRRIAPPTKVSRDGDIRLTAPADLGAYVQLEVRAHGEAVPVGQVFGFARFVADGASSRRSDSYFGLVHGDPQDPFIPAWNKTLTWQTLDPPAWRERLRRIEGAGQRELPLVLGHEWTSNDARPVGRAQLDALRARAERYFAATPAGSVWELGLEENLSPHYRQSHYWPNLRRKVEALRAAAQRIDPSIRFAYQIAGIAPADVRRFLESEAAALFDILALHPYAWPDFPDPTLWLDGFLSAVRGEMERTGRELPIWFTEVGAPVRGQQPAPRLVTADSRQPVLGLDRAAAVGYLVKLHAIALHAGVERIFWYHYQDRGATSDDPEDYFGLRDAAGFPKPTYVAHHLLRRHLDGKRPGRLLQPAPGARFYEFTDGATRTLVGWSAHGTATIPLAAIAPEHRDGEPVEITNGVGDPRNPLDGQLQLGSEPLILTFRTPQP